MAKIETYTEKTALADDDLFVIADSAAANATKKVKASTVWKTNLIEDNGAGISLKSTTVNADGFRISIHNDGAIAIGDTGLNSGGLTLQVDDSNGWIKIDNTAHDVAFFINNVQGGSGTIDTTATPNLVFNNGIFISAS